MAKNSKMLMGIFIVGIMILSIFGFVLNYQLSPAKRFKYNGIRFTQTGQGWSAEMDGNEKFFVFHPEEVEHINLTEETKSLLTNPFSVALSYDDSKEAATLAELQYYAEQNLADRITVIRGVTSNMTALPQITCDSATEKQPVLLFRLGNQTQVVTQDSCVIVEGIDGRSLVQLTDWVQYALLGVINV